MKIKLYVGMAIMATSAAILIGCNMVRDQICELPILGSAGAQTAPAKYFPKDIPKDYGPRANECKERRASGTLEGIGARIVGENVILAWSVPAENTSNLPATATVKVAIHSCYPAQGKENLFRDERAELVMPGRTRLIAGEIKIPIDRFEIKYLDIKKPENWFDGIDSQTAWSGIMVNGPGTQLEFLWAGEDPDGTVRLRWISRMVSAPRKLIAVCESPAGVPRPEATAVLDTSRIPIAVTCILIDRDGKEVARDRAEIPGSAGPQEASGWFRLDKEKALKIAWERCRAEWNRRLELIPPEGVQAEK